ncbi:type II toxin-antitoxin system RelE/ParE family toxin [Bifidobacterium sp. ESL0790]|uniref:type II toxin-antitoxin system RelE/ParE family toxin n=1 Tax=Bifidobacterium sp. ESL0790 TaxID=2983233 RepID=UPI0023F9665D|nr:type II toxin-antitoxin system RelE/ParE family toxin [Bifidobacterium sp. ESL0790]WEV72788.1 type II toxin-antitoxin system RelE/ParE family toxin [Bifidobacterium sp. ESL0790]
MRVLASDEFEGWIDTLPDAHARNSVNFWIERIKATGKVTGDCKDLKDGVHERRFHKGPGYRVYYMFSGRELILLLAGGDKGSQRRDIARAKKMCREWKARAAPKK